MTRVRWTDETILTALGDLTAELGRHPQRADFSERNMMALYEAIRRRGGIREWIHRLEADLNLTEAPQSLSPTALSDNLPTIEEIEALPPTETAIRERAYFLSQENPGAPEHEHWLQAERELRAEQQ